LKFQCLSFFATAFASNNFLQYEAKVYSCNLQAELSIVKKNGIALGLDAAGYIPGEGVVAGFSQSVIATASFFNSAVSQDSTGMVVSAAGTGAIIGGIVQETGVAWAKAIPFIGWGVNTIATVHDLSSAYSTGAGAYNACMNKSN